MTDAMTGFGAIAASGSTARRRLVILFSLLLVMAAAASALFLVRAVDTQIAEVVQTHDARRQARDLILTLVDAETGQRGYLLTQDPRYLEPYREAMARVDTVHARLAELVANDADQLARLAAMSEAIGQKRAEMATTIELAAGGQLAPALEILRSDAGQALMDQLRDTVQRFVAHEDARLVERNAAMERDRQLLVIAILVALAGAAILTYLLLTRTQRQVSSLARASTALQSQNEELEEHVRRRTAEAEEARAHAERERARVEALLQDTNHRIGNSLATVSSLLGLQVARSRSPEVKAALEAAQSRVHAISSGHRRLRLGADHDTTNAAEFLESVLEDLRAPDPAAAGPVFHTELEPLVIKARDATTIGIVLGELVTNALKHAFPDGRAGRIWVRLLRDDAGAARLEVEDDGIGLAAEPSGPESGLGAMIIRQLANQFGGTAVYGQRPGGGTVVTIALPELELNPAA